MNQISFGAYANFSSAVPWGLWVSVYTWLVGISAGSFAFVMWGTLTGKGPLTRVTRQGIILSIATLLVGLISIQIDLGRIDRFYLLLISFNPTSVMAWVVRLYGLYFVVLIVALGTMTLRAFKGGVPRALAGFGMVFALALIVIESFFFAKPPGKHWHSPIFIVHFLTSSLASAIGSLILVGGLTPQKDERTDLLKGLRRIAVPFVALSLGAQLVDMFVLSGIGHPGGWGLVVGHIVVIALLLRDNPLATILAGALGLVVMLLSKYDGLISAQLVEPYSGFGEAFIEPRLPFMYTPTFFEYLVAIVLVCVSAGLFYLLVKVIPQRKEN